MIRPAVPLSDTWPISYLPARAMGRVLGGVPLTDSASFWIRSSMEIDTVSSKAPLVLTGSYTGTDAEWCANITEEAVLTRKRLELDRSLRQLQIRKPLK